MDLYDLALQPSPEEQQARRAAMLRAAATRGQRSDAISEATSRAQKLALLNSIVQMANNPGAAAAVGAMHKSNQDTYNPKQLGTQGYMLPSSGEFVASPMFTEEREAERASKQDLARENQAAALQRTREQLIARAQAAEERNALLSAIAAGRNDTALAIAGLNNSTRKDIAANKPGPRLRRDQAESLSTLGKTVETYTDLEGSFKDEFAGNAVLGAAKKAAASTFGNWAPESSIQMNEWWANYKRNSELVERHALFGSALTATEQKQWREADIHPGLNPRVIKDRMAKRKDLADKVLQKTGTALMHEGYDEDAIREYGGGYFRGKKRNFEAEYSK